MPTYSVIIPHRNSIELLPTLFSSIPDNDNVEILLIDNSNKPITLEDIPNNRKCKLLYSSPERGAGGARNVGIEQATGKWLIFADADDFFAKDAFDVFDKNKDSSADIIYYSVDGIYLDTKEPADRADSYKRRIKGYETGEVDEYELRLRWSVPWGKMIRKSLVDDFKIRYDEIVASNDIYFSTLVGYYAKSINVVSDIVYIVTVSTGTLTRRRDYSVIKSRLYAKLKCNRFLKQHGHKDRQWSVMFYLSESRHLGLMPFIEFLKMIISFRQNPFVGISQWSRSSKKVAEQDGKESKYIKR